MTSCIVIKLEMLETPNIIFSTYLEIDNIFNFNRLFALFVKEKKTKIDTKNFYRPKYFLLILLPFNLYRLRLSWANLFPILLVNNYFVMNPKICSKGKLFSYLVWNWNLVPIYFSYDPLGQGEMLTYFSFHS